MNQGVSETGRRTVEDEDTRRAETWRCQPRQMFLSLLRATLRLQAPRSAPAKPPAGITSLCHGARALASAPEGRGSCFGLK
ncbi:Hypothetical protein SMAX5B_013035 [Scophthalmus maximus]|uniref:Uncharacterized protein n=1 Tax=Scophthalmus maximus TaxID=52904 RepID=A0A2U9BEL7_SCOMX|nr:Hypothetical protein SMAX5B_013035 [Scophthalmus maximus]